VYTLPPPHGLELQQITPVNQANNAASPPDLPVASDPDEEPPGVLGPPEHQGPAVVAKARVLSEPAGAHLRRWIEVLVVLAADVRREDRHLDLSERVKSIKRHYQKYS